MQQFELKDFFNQRELKEYETRRINANNVDTEDNFPTVLDKVQNFEVVLDIKRGDDS